ncbi:MAG: DUF1553 domain-containing protein, partial [Pirellulales bacterium]
DGAKSGVAAGAEAEQLARAASQLEREAAVKSGEALVLANEQLLLEAEAKPAEDANRASGIEAAARQLAEARTALDKARAAAADAAQGSTYTPLGPRYPERSTGRRRALARWITSPANPLTARVAVNHIWLRHFHAPLVASVFDFGRNGAPPTHPELLDWLAVEFVESGWKMKPMHRLIVTSQAYQMASSPGPDPGNIAIDPENKLLWRMNVGRMESEAVRDSLLHAAGRLDAELGGQELENSQALTTRRRSLYYSCHPETDGKSQLGALFDAPDAMECYRRTRSIMPQQALALTNSELVHELGSELAGALWKSLSVDERSDPSAYVAAAFEEILSRGPTAVELELCVKFLSSQPEVSAPSTAEAAATRGRASLVRALLNHNDFITIR